MTTITLFLIGLSATNLWAFGLFALDKHQARNHQRRTPESRLLSMALIGGLGAWFGQHILRHKTRKEPFRTQLGFMMAGHAVLVAALVWLILTHRFQMPPIQIPAL